MIAAAAIVATANLIAVLVLLWSSSGRNVVVRVETQRWAVRPNATYSGSMQRTDIGPLSSGALVTTLALSNCAITVFISTMHFCAWNWDLRWLARVDEIVFYGLGNLALALVVGLTDFSDLFWLFAISTVPTTISEIAESRTAYMHMYKKLHSEHKDMDPENGKVHVNSWLAWLWKWPVVISFAYTLVPALGIWVEHLSATAPASAHVAVFLTFVAQIGVRVAAGAAQLYVENPDTSEGRAVRVAIERFALACAACLTCMVVLYSH